MRSFTEIISESFIWGVGITRPKPGQERRAAIFITAILAATVLGIVAVFFFILGKL